MTSLNLKRSIQFGGIVLTDYPFQSEFGMSYEAGDLVTSVLSSFLEDGDLEISQRRGNMTLTIPLLLEGTDLLELAEIEAALAIEAQKSTNTLVINPGDGFAPPTVFDTFEADVSFPFDDDLEQVALRRIVLTIKALPFGRSDFEVVAAAFVGPLVPVTETVSDASSLTGWTGSPNAVALTGGGTQVTEAGAGTGGSIYTLAATYTATIDVSSTRYIVVDHSWTGVKLGGSGISGRANGTSPSSGTAMTEVSTTAIGGGLYRTYLEVPDGYPTSLTSLRFSTDFLDPPGTTGASVSIDKVTRTNVPPMTGTTKQQLRTAVVAGSARTQARIEVYSPTTSLGDVLLYTAPVSGFNPALRTLATSGPGTADAACVSGSYNSLASPFEAAIPLDSLTPGLYALMARVASPAGGARSLTWRTAARFGANEVGRVKSGTAAVTGTGYQFVVLGNVTLPTVAARPGSTGVQAVSIQDASSTSAARIDELYAFNVSTGRLSIVACGTGTPAAGGPASRLWVSSATVASRTPSVMLGTREDGHDAYYAGDAIRYLNTHEVVPREVAAFLVTTNAPDAQVGITHYPRWLGHAALTQ